MPHYSFDTREDGSIRRVLRDGLPHGETVTLEQVYSVVTLYFRLALRNIQAMGFAETNDGKRMHGVQSFIMSLTGLEAFINTYFHVRADELGNSDMLTRITQTHGSLTKKLVDLVGLTPDGPLHDQEMLIDRLFELCQLRNDLMHPRWEPSGVTIEGELPVHIFGMVENPHALFEDETLCREAMFWCLLAVARVGQARGVTSLEGFVFHWTGNMGMSVSGILESLGLPPEI